VLGDLPDCLYEKYLCMNFTYLWVYVYITYICTCRIRGREHIYTCGVRGSGVRSMHWESFLMKVGDLVDEIRRL